MFRSTVPFCTLPVAIDDILMKILVMNQRNHVRYYENHPVKIAQDSLEQADLRIFNASGD